MRVGGFVQILACLALGFAPCWAIIGIILARARKGAGSDRARDFHHGSAPVIPRLGGIAIVAAFLIIAAAAFNFTEMTPESAATLGAIVLSSLAMFFLGLWD